MVSFEKAEIAVPIQLKTASPGDEDGLKCRQ
jgi:hypothetical protein